MGLFDGLLGRSREEIELEQRYLPVFLAVGARLGQDGREMFKKLFEAAKAKWKNEGGQRYPLNYGTLLLQAESTDETLAARLQFLRSEGVTDQDIISHFATSNLEHCLVDVWHDFRGMLIMRIMEARGMSAAESAWQIRKSLPIYGDPLDNRHVSGEDRAFPWELRIRINNFWSAKGFDVESVHDAQTASTANAWIRVQMRAGAL